MILARKLDNLKKETVICSDLSSVIKDLVFHSVRCCSVVGVSTKLVMHQIYLRRGYNNCWRELGKRRGAYWWTKWRCQIFKRFWCGLRGQQLLPPSHRQRKSSNPRDTASLWWLCLPIWKWFPSRWITPIHLLLWIMLLFSFFFSMLENNKMSWWVICVWYSTCRDCGASSCWLLGLHNRFAATESGSNVFFAKRTIRALSYPQLFSIYVLHVQ